MTTLRNRNGNKPFDKMSFCILQLSNTKYQIYMQYSAFILILFYFALYRIVAVFAPVL